MRWDLHSFGIAIKVIFLLCKMLQTVFLPENLHLDDCIKRKNRSKYFQFLAGEVGVEG